MTEYKYKEWTGYLEHCKYQLGGICLKLMDSSDGGPIITFTKYVESEFGDPYKLQNDELAIKNYSENEGAYTWLIDNNIISPFHRLINNGFAVFPICRLKV
jgi:hypothetical protein